MNTPEIKQFIRDHSNLFWYIPEEKKEEISLELLVETILNYGDIKAVKNLFELLGINKTAAIFFDTIQQSDRRKANYQELTINFFTLFFKRHAN